jgi:hypothetical protein
MRPLPVQDRQQNDLIGDVVIIVGLEALRHVVRAARWMGVSWIGGCTATLNARRGGMA